MNEEILNNIWSHLSSENLTDSDFDQWSKNFTGSDEVQSNVYNYLKDNQLTESDYDSWLSNIGVKKKDPSSVSTDSQVDSTSGLGEFDVQSYINEGLANRLTLTESSTELLNGLRAQAGLNIEELQANSNKLDELNKELGNLKERFHGRLIHPTEFHPEKDRLNAEIEQLESYFEANSSVLNKSKVEYDQLIQAYIEDSTSELEGEALTNEWNNLLKETGADKNNFKVRGLTINEGEGTTNQFLALAENDDVVAQWQREYEETGEVQSIRLTDEAKETPEGKLIQELVDRQAKSGHRAFDVLESAATVVPRLAANALHLKAKFHQVVGDDFNYALTNTQISDAESAENKLRDKIRWTEHTGAVQAIKDGADFEDVAALTANMIAETGSELLIASATANPMLFMATSAGVGKHRELDKMDATGKVDMSEGQKLLNALGTSAAVYASEKVTFGILDDYLRAKGGIKNFNNPKEFIKEYIAPVIPNMIKEGNTELLEQAAEMVVDAATEAGVPESTEEGAMMLAEAWYGGAAFMGAGGGARASVATINKGYRDLFRKPGFTDVTIFKDGQEIQKMDVTEFYKFMEDSENMDELISGGLTVDVSQTAKGKELLDRIEKMTSEEYKESAASLVQAHRNLSHTLSDLNALDKDSEITDVVQVVESVKASMESYNKVMAKSPELDITGNVSKTYKILVKALSDKGVTINNNLEEQSVQGANVSSDKLIGRIDNDAELKAVEKQLEEGVAKPVVVKSQEILGFKGAGKNVQSQITTGTFTNTNAAKIAVQKYKNSKKKLTASEQAVVNFEKNNSRLNKLDQSSLGSVDMETIKEGNWFGLTATREGLSEASNKKRNDLLKSILDGMEGVEYTEVDGLWQGKPEKSLIITGLTPKQAKDLGNQFNQDAVISGKDGLLFQDGSSMKIDGAMFTGDAALEQDGLTIVKDKNTGEIVPFSLSLSGEMKRSDDITSENIEELDSIKAKYGEKRGKILGQIASIMNMGTGIKFKIYQNSNALQADVEQDMRDSGSHPDKESIAQLANEYSNARAFYKGSDGSIYVNMELVQENTLFHEITHPLVDFIKENDPVLYSRIEQAVKDSDVALKWSKDGRRRYTYMEWAKEVYPNQTESLQIEEAFAEMMGDAALGKWKNTEKWNRIIDLFNAVLEAVGLRPIEKADPGTFTLGDASSLKDITTELAEAMAKGQKIELRKTEFEVKPEGEDRFQADFVDPITNIQYSLDANSGIMEQLEESGDVTHDKTLADFDGKTMIVHAPDAMFSGAIIDEDGTILVEGKGGVMYPIRFHEDGYFWASTSGMAKGMAALLNSTLEANNGSIYMALTSSPNDKLLSSTAMARGLVNLMTSKNVLKKLGLKEADVFKALAKGAINIDSNSKSGLGLKLKTSLSNKKFRDTELRKLYEALDSSVSSFDQRRAFSDGFLTNLVKITNEAVRAGRAKPDSKSRIVKMISPGLLEGVGPQVSASNIQSLKNSLVTLMTEPRLRRRHKTDMVYAVLEIKGKVVPKLDSSYESYGGAIISEAGNKTKVHFLKESQHWPSESVIKGVTAEGKTIEETTAISSSGKEGPLKRIVLPMQSGVSKPVEIYARRQADDSWFGGSGLFGRFKTFASTIESELEKVVDVTEPKGTVGFAEWFGESVFKDSEGEPVVMYHGTGSENIFESFRISKLEGNVHFGAFFSPDPEFASDFSESHNEGVPSRVIPVYLRVENPFDYSDESTWTTALEAGIITKEFMAEVNERAETYGDNWRNMEQITGKLKNAGYDGVFMLEDDVRNVAVFDPTQIRSVYRQDYTNLADTRFQKVEDGLVGISEQNLEKLKATYNKIQDEYNVEVKDGMISLYHYSDDLRDVIDPALAGRKSYSNEEYRTWGRSRVFFYTDENIKEGILLSDVKHKAVLPIDRVYPLTEDPLNFKEEALANIEKFREGPKKTKLNLRFETEDFNAVNLSISRVKGLIKDEGYEDLIKFGDLEEYTYPVYKEDKTWDYPKGLSLSLLFDSNEDVSNYVKGLHSNIDGESVDPKTQPINIYEEVAKVAEKNGFTGFIYDHVGGKTVTSWEKVNVTEDRFQVYNPRREFVYHSPKMSFLMDINRLALEADYALGRWATKKDAANMPLDIRLSKLLFSPEGAHSDKEIKQMFIKTKGFIDFHIKKAESVFKKVEKAAKAANMSHETVNAYLKGDENINTILNKELREALTMARAHIDFLSKSLVEEGLVKGEMVATIDANMGFYLTRKFKLHESKFWKPEDRAKITRLEDFFRKELQESNPDLKGTELEDRVKGKVNALIHGKDAKRISKYGFGSALGRDNTIFKHRSEIPAEIADILQEIDDPKYNYMNTISKIAKVAASEQLFVEMKQKGLVSETESGENYHQLSGEKWGSIAGYYVTPEMYSVLNTSFGDTGMISNLGVQMFMRAVAASKKFKTIYNPATHVKNVLGNVSFATMNGHFDLSQMKESFKATIQSVKGFKDNDLMHLYEDLISLGVLDSNVSVGEIKGIIDDISNSTVHKFLDGTFLGKVDKFVTDAYQSEDNVWKIYGFLNERNRFIDAGYTESQARSIAARNIRATYPNYSEIPKIVRMIGRSPIVGTFVAFQSEVIRNTINVMKIASLELKSGNPKVRAIGLKRLGGTAANFVVMGTIFRTATELLMNVMDEGYEEEDEGDNIMNMIREVLAPWDKNGKIVVTERGFLDTKFAKDQKNPDVLMEYINMSALEGTGYLSNLMTIALEGIEGPRGESAMQNFLEEAASPFFQKDMLLSTLQELEEEISKTDDWDEQLKDGFNFLMKKVGPGFVGSGYRIAEAAFEEETEKKVSNELFAFFGFRMNRVNVNKSLFFKSKEVKELLKSRMKDLNEEYEDVDINMSNIQDVYDSDEKTKKYVDVMARNVVSAWMQGVSEGDVKAAMKAGGISGRLADDIIDLALFQYNNAIQKKLSTERFKDE